MTRTKRALISAAAFVLLAAVGCGGGWLLGREMAKGSVYGQLQSALDYVTAQGIPLDGHGMSADDGLNLLAREEEQELERRGIPCRVSFYCKCGVILAIDDEELSAGNHSYGLPDTSEGIYVEREPFAYEEMKVDGKTYYVGAKSADGNVVRVEISEENVSQSGSGVTIPLMIVMGAVAGAIGAAAAWRLTRPKQSAEEEVEEG